MLKSTDTFNLRGDPALFVGGDWIEADDREEIELINPATEDVIGLVPVATARDVKAAISAADAAFRSWRGTLPITRSNILRKAATIMRENAEGMAQTLSREQGKIIAEARLEVQTVADLFDWFAEECRRSYGRVVESRVEGVKLHVVQEPVGPVAAFCTWNFPGLVPARKIGAAVAAGCSIVVKAAEETPGTAVHIVQALEAAGLPAGVVNLLFGNPAEISTILVDAPEIRMITLTGSTRVGKLLAKQAAATMKPAIFELGGHNPVIVFEDADIEKAVAHSAAAKFRNAGQVCLAPDRFFVHEDVHDAFVDRMVEYASELAVGEGVKDGIHMGALTNRARLDEVTRLVDNAVAKGAKLCFGGARIGNRGYFYSPTVLTDVPDEADIMQIEPFGPVAPVQKFRSLDDAIARSNSLRFGLASYVFSSSIQKIDETAAALEAGLVGANTCAVSHHEGPLGGVKESGYGREGSIEGLRAYQITKLVAHNVLS
ncbi:MAG: NAD-dependent succinate-semialdehyde dehydrogenase [Hyphomicrobiaceae bacterium]|nr:NAD-dependent succinate-semialdehyde dehydrogenase [Hyphomicrobiaceae bacterium]